MASTRIVRVTYSGADNDRAVPRSEDGPVFHHVDVEVPHLPRSGSQVPAWVNRDWARRQAASHAELPLDKITYADVDLIG